jgi:hypothetical protein
MQTHPHGGLSDLCNRCLKPRKAMSFKASHAWAPSSCRSCSSRIHARVRCRANGSGPFRAASRVLEDKQREVTRTLTEPMARLGKQCVAYLRKNRLCFFHSCPITRLWCLCSTRLARPPLPGCIEVTLQYLPRIVILCEHDVLDTYLTRKNRQCLCSMLHSCQEEHETCAVHSELQRFV